MSIQYLTKWRNFIYTNHLYSLPHVVASTHNYRSYRPAMYSSNSWELGRIMMWVNRELTVLVTNRLEALNAYDIILGMLPQTRMDSAEFSQMIGSFFGNKTQQFVHELVNFARSPYDDIIGYECHTKYRALKVESCDDRPSTSAAAAAARNSRVVHNFPEFAQRINDDEFCGLDFEFDDKQTLVEEINEMVTMRDYNDTLINKLRGGCPAKRSQVQQQQPTAAQQPTRAPTPTPTSTPTSVPKPSHAAAGTSPSTPASTATIAATPTATDTSLLGFTRPHAQTIPRALTLDMNQLMEMDGSFHEDDQEWAERDFYANYALMRAMTSSTTEGRPSSRFNSLNSVGTRTRAASNTGRRRRNFSPFGNAVQTSNVVFRSPLTRRGRRRRGLSSNRSWRY